MKNGIFLLETLPLDTFIVKVCLHYSKTLSSLSDGDPSEDGCAQGIGMLQPWRGQRLVAQQLGLSKSVIS